MEDKILELRTALKALLEKIPEPLPSTYSFGDATRKKIRSEIMVAIEKLNKVALHLDPVAQPKKIFDPSDPLLIGELMAKTLLMQESLSLAELKRFYGSGVYAIYYNGKFPAYSLIKGTDTPIYVGKVDPDSATARTPEEQGDKLWKRLINDHAKNIRLAENLNLEDFKCRYLVVKSSWQITAETYLIDWFKPVWNSEINICYGFGKHGDSSDTRANTRSPWDELHPGRPWARTAKPFPKNAGEITKMILEHSRKYHSTPKDILLENQ